MATPDVHDDYPVGITSSATLDSNRIAVIGNKIYAKYPIPITFCSEHTKATRSSRNINNIMMHVCGKDHLDIRNKMTTVDICGICDKAVKNITAHMRNLHQVDIFDTRKAVDMKDICDNRESSWLSYYGSGDRAWHSQ